MCRSNSLGTLHSTHRPLHASQDHHVVMDGDPTATLFLYSAAPLLPSLLTLHLASCTSPLGPLNSHVLLCSPTDPLSLSSSTSLLPLLLYLSSYSLIPLVFYLSSSTSSPLSLRSTCPLLNLIIYLPSSLLSCSTSSLLLFFLSSLCARV